MEKAPSPIFSDEEAISIQGSTLTLVPALAEHVDALYIQMQDEDNIRLFKSTYRKTCSPIPTLAEFGHILLDYRVIRPHSITWTIIDNATHRAVGWALLRSCIMESSTAEVSLFLRKCSRSERGTEVVHILNPLLFNQMRFRKHEFRAGTLTESHGANGGPLGMSLIGVLSRQLKDSSRSKESDLYVLTKEQWPAVAAAVQAWLDAGQSGRCRAGVVGCERKAQKEMSNHDTAGLSMQHSAGTGVLLTGESWDGPINRLASPSV